MEFWIKMKYEYAPDLQKVAVEMSMIFFPHIKVHNIMCFRSYGTSSRVTIARCHTLDKIMQKAIGRSSFYVLEFLSEHFDNLSEEDKLKTIMHELIHIPKTFGGGFKHHNYVTEKNVDKHYETYKKIKEKERNSNENQA